MADRIETSLVDGVFTIILNRPEKHNCIGWEMLNGLDEMLKKAESEQEIKVLVIRGAGEKAFSSGADLKEFDSLDPAGQKKWIVFGNELFNRLETLPKPTVAVLQGYVIGGGLELALACDFRLAAYKTLFSFPEVANGWLPGWGGLVRLPKIAGQTLAKSMILLGEKLDGVQAKQAGLVNRLVEHSQLEEALEEMTMVLKKTEPWIYQLAKSALQDQHRTTSGADLLFDVLALRGKEF
jgi:enoyl-CoA hydratase/carnithine racemase